MFQNLISSFNVGNARGAHPPLEAPLLQAPIQWIKNNQDATGLQDVSATLCQLGVRKLPPNQRLMLDPESPQAGHLAALFAYSAKFERNPQPLEAAKAQLLALGDDKQAYEGLRLLQTLCLPNNDDVLVSTDVLVGNKAMPGHHYLAQIATSDQESEVSFAQRFADLHASGCAVLDVLQCALKEPEEHMGVIAMLTKGAGLCPNHAKAEGNTLLHLLCQRHDGALDQAEQRDRLVNLLLQGIDMGCTWRLNKAGEHPLQLLVKTPGDVGEVLVERLEDRACRGDATSHFVLYQMLINGPLRGTAFRHLANATRLQLPEAQVETAMLLKSGRMPNGFSGNPEALLDEALRMGSLDAACLRVLDGNVSLENKKQLMPLIHDGYRRGHEGCLLIEGYRAIRGPGYSQKISSEVQRAGYDIHDDGPGEHRFLGEHKGQRLLADNIQRRYPLPNLGDSSRGYAWSRFSFLEQL
ncbi:MAG TPA: hypothetical protein VFV39_06600 [Limnobacter sp.]|nr:hypothetical protein [Limnobacter sp.]